MATVTYAHPEVLVDTTWTEQHLATPRSGSWRSMSIRKRMRKGMSPVPLDGTGRHNFPIRCAATLSRKTDLEKLLGEAGIDNNTTVILYGDNNNWFAAMGFLGIEDLWPQGCPDHERGTEEMAGGRTAADQGRSRGPQENLSRKRTRFFSPCVSSGCLPISRPHQRLVSGRCAVGRRIFREDPFAPGPAGDLPEGRPYPRGVQCPLGEECE